MILTLQEKPITIITVALFRDQPGPVFPPGLSVAYAWTTSLPETGPKIRDLIKSRTSKQFFSQTKPIGQDDTLVCNPPHMLQTRVQIQARVMG